MKQTWKSRRAHGVKIVLFAMLGAVGCAEPTGRITGTVSYEGQPLPGGRVTFLCDGEGRPVVGGRISESGTYDISNLPAGKARVSVQTFKRRPKPPPIVDAATGTPVPDEWDDYGPYVAIPRRYGAPHTSGLEFIIKPGEQSFDIVLEK
jgi:hypothetical protein